MTSRRDGPDAGLPKVTFNVLNADVYSAAEKTALSRLCLCDRAEQKGMNLAENVLAGGDRAQAVEADRHAWRPRVGLDELAPHQAGQMLQDELRVLAPLDLIEDGPKVLRLGP